MKRSRRAKISHRAKKVVNKRKPSKSPIIIKGSLLIIVLFVFFATIFKITEFIVSNINDFPKLEISLNDVTIEQINLNSKDIKYPNNTIIATINNASTTYDNVEIKGRGNSTWNQPKKPYQIKFSQKTSLFGHNEAKKWILLADYLDQTHLRNNTAFYLQHLLNTENPINGNYSELFIDNVYYGLYYISEKTEIDKNRINLNDPFGIIMELNNLHVAITDCAVRSLNGNCFTIHDSVNQDESIEATTNFIEKFNQLEFAISQKDYQTISQIIDIDSFAKYFLLNEFTNNPDAYITSFFFIMDGLNDKIHAGSGWDFDLSLGNKEWQLDEIDSEAFLSPFNTMPFKGYFEASEKKIGAQISYESYTDRISTLFYDLMDIPKFSQRVREIYQSTLSGTKDELLNYIRNQANYIRDAAYRDQARWKLKTNFDEEVNYLLDWVTKRYEHFEATYEVNSLDEEQNVERQTHEDNPTVTSIPDQAPESLPL